MAKQTEAEPKSVNEANAPLDDDGRSEIKYKILSSNCPRCLQFIDFRPVAGVEMNGRVDRIVSC